MDPNIYWRTELKDVRDLEPQIYCFIYKVFFMNLKKIKINFLKVVKTQIKYIDLSQTNLKFFGHKYVK